MTDLISRQAAVDALDGVKVDEEYCTEYDIGYNDGIDFAVSKLSVLPSAEPKPSELARDIATIIEDEMDMRVVLKNAEPEIIKCKDCRWFKKLGCAIKIVDDSDKPKENDFCSFAERRTDERFD